MVVEVGAVYDEEDFVDFGQGGGDLGGFEAGEGFARSGGVPDVAVFVGFFDALNDFFYGVVLIGAQ